MRVLCVFHPRYRGTPPGFACIPMAPGRLWDRVEAIKRSARLGQSGSSRPSEVSCILQAFWRCSFLSL